MTLGCWECYFDLKFHHVRCEHQFIVWRYNFTCALSSLLWTLVWTKFLLPLNNHNEWHHGNVTSKVEPSLSFIFWLEVYLGREGWLAWWSPLCDNVLRSWDVKLCDVTRYILYPPLSTQHWGVLQLQMKRKSLRRKWIYLRVTQTHLHQAWPIVDEINLNTRIRVILTVCILHYC